MKISEARKILKRMKSPLLSADEDHAIQTAIKSLEAWKKVIWDIEESCTMVDNTDVIAGYHIALIIIRKYLKGVEK